MSSTGSNVDPTARVVADSHGLDATAFTGTGPRGVVTVADVLAVVETKRQILAAQANAAATARPAAAAQPTDGELSDTEASAVLWRLGVRAGLERPPEQIWAVPPIESRSEIVMNADGTGYWARKSDL